MISVKWTKYKLCGAYIQLSGDKFVLDIDQYSDYQRAVLHR